MKGGVLLPLYTSAQHVACLTILILEVLSTLSVLSVLGHNMKATGAPPTFYSLLPAQAWHLLSSRAYDDLRFDSPLPTNLGPLLPY